MGLCGTVMDNSLRRVFIAVDLAVCTIPSAILALGKLHILTLEFDALGREGINQNCTT